MGVCELAIMREMSKRFYPKNQSISQSVPVSGFSTFVTDVNSRGALMNDQGEVSVCPGNSVGYACVCAIASGDEDLAARSPSYECARE